MWATREVPEIPAELFKSLKEDAIKVLHSLCQQIWKTRQWPQDWKRSILNPIPKKRKWKKVKSLSRVRLFATPWTIAHQAPLSMGFCRQEYWSELPCPPPEDLPNPGFEPRSPTLQADSSPFGPPGEPVLSYFCHQEEKYGKIHGKLGKYLFDFVDIYKLRVMSASSS